MRALVMIPILHTLADLGSQGDTVKHAYVARYGWRQWEQHVQSLDSWWREMRQRVLSLPLEWRGVRLYQDSLPVCGHEEAIVEDLATAGSPNYQLLRELVARGAILMGTETPDLLRQEHAQQSHAPHESVSPASPSAQSALLAQRDAAIARRIATTLQDEEWGLLFIGALHQVAAYLPVDIRVYGLDETLGHPSQGNLHDEP